MTQNISIRRSEARGKADFGWLHAKYTFSFGDYHDPDHMGFSVLRVINEDRIDGGMGFQTHGHRDMEILTYIIDGALEHQDSMGNKAIIKPGEIQRMSAGTGVRHSEFNHEKNHQTHLLQIWILPDRNGHPPSYGQMNFEAKIAEREFILLASQKGREGSITLNQDVDVYLGRSKKNMHIHHPVNPQRSLWIQVVRGQLGIADETLSAGDGAGIQEATDLELIPSADTEFLLFDMPR